VCFAFDIVIKSCEINLFGQEPTPAKPPSPAPKPEEPSKPVPPKPATIKPERKPKQVCVFYFLITISFDSIKL